MAIKKTNCINHPDRPAIGVCMITRKPICAECSTQYEGVNYSREGLAILMERRALETKKIAFHERAVEIGVAVSTPVLLYMVYLFYFYAIEAFINIAQLE